jgi:membrane protein
VAKKRGPGHRAKGPSELPARSWRDVLRRTWVAMSEKNMSVIAAGIAFYEVWAFFPALVALVIIGGVFFGEGAVVRLLSWIRIDLPESFDVVVVSQLKAIAQQSRGIFSLTLVGAVLFSFWSAMRGVRGLIQALNVVYEEDEERPFWRRQLLAFWLSCFCGGLLLIAISLIVSLPPYAAHGGEKISFIVLAPSRWPFLILLLMISLSVIYRYGPCRLAAKWRWVTWGATTSATVIVVGSFLFSYYASQYAHFNPLLGSLGAITIFLFWSYLNVLAILFGAQINAELERKLR